MGIKERREREKQITKQAILLAARQIARQEGWTALTIRKVAEQIEYSPPMVYEYFSSKESIFLALLHEGFEMLEEAMRQAQHSNPDVQEQLYRIGEAYWQFASDNPDLYQVMHGLSGVSIDPQETAKAVQKVCAIPLEALETWAKANQVTLADPMAYLEVTWCVLHGIVSLTIVNRVDTNRSRAMIQQTLEDLLFAWQSKLS
jgi:AcrR family transcriptional regulator